MESAVPGWPGELHACTECGIRYEEITAADALAIAGSVPPSLVRLVSAAAPADLVARPGPGIWSALEYACHIRDVFSAYAIRLHRSRVEDRPAVEPMFNDLRAHRFNYNGRDPAAVVAEAADTADGFVQEASALTDDDWSRQVARLPGETRTALWLARQAAHEGQHHLLDIVLALDRSSR